MHARQGTSLFAGIVLVVVAIAIGTTRPAGSVARTGDAAGGQPVIGVGPDTLVFPDALFRWAGTRFARFYLLFKVSF